MLPLYGLAVVSAKQGDPATIVAATIVVAQATMVLASLVAMRMSASRGLWLAVFISFLTLPVRGLIAATVIKSWGIFPVQILDGIGAGLQSVAVPALVARILNGTGPYQRRSRGRHDRAGSRLRVESGDRRLGRSMAGV
jgi:hypothetical protein